MYVRFEVNEDTPFLDVMSCMLVEIDRQCEETNWPPFSGPKTDTSTRLHIPQHSIVTNTHVPQFKLARFSCNIASLYLRRRRSGVETYIRNCFNYTPLCLQLNVIF